MPNPTYHTVVPPQFLAITVLHVLLYFFTLTYPQYVADLSYRFYVDFKVRIFGDSIWSILILKF